MTIVTANEILKIARQQVGVKESPAGSNNVLYNTAYYGRAVSGSAYPWCCTFIWWVFNVSRAPELFYGGGKTASSTTLMNYYKSKGQFITSGYRPGDIVFYTFDGGKDADHVGIVNSVSGNVITAIEGNTSLTSNDNGGSVMIRQRSGELILGCAKINYEEDEDMSGEEILKKINEYTATLSVPEWAKEELQEAVDMGITDGSNLMGLIPRYQAVLLAKRAAKR